MMPGVAKATGYMTSTPAPVRTRNTNAVLTSMSPPSSDSGTGSGSEASGPLGCSSAVWFYCDIWVMHDTKFDRAKLPRIFYFWFISGLIVRRLTASKT